MGSIKAATLSRHRAPAFVMCGGLELIQLRKLRWLSRCLFFELLAMADHSTGRIETSYAVLAALLDFDQDPCAHAKPGPTTKRIRTALADLAALGLVRVDRIANEKRQGLFLKVAGRAGIGAPSESSGRLRGRVSPPKKPAAAKTYAAKRATEGQTEGQGIQELIPTPTPSLSTAPDAARRKLREIADGIAARGETRAPKGARPSPLRGTPPGAAPPEPAWAGSSPLDSHHQGPQGGQAIAPAGHAPQQVTD